MKKGYIFYILIFITSIITIAPAQSEANNKKASEIVHNGKIIKIIDDSIYDSARKCAIPIRVYLDQSHGPKPVILFSHGLGGSRENNGFLGKYWAAKGYVSIPLVSEELALSFY
jgi:predicted dienelactone hydrolase